MEGRCAECGEVLPHYGECGEYLPLEEGLCDYCSWEWPEEGTYDLRARYDAMIARVRARGNLALVEALTEERDAKLLAAEVEAREAATDRLLLSAARGIAWGHWNL